VSNGLLLTVELRVGAAVVVNTAKLVIEDARPVPVAPPPRSGGGGRARRAAGEPDPHPPVDRRPLP